ncbi:trinucleotide repeat-containing gene 18 protein-like isoform X2 [Dysidea avara]|uniref:trinucleotide repeat-containing gene 18 protein-like isoform X2 n=1 Tax=Dysidea avara TaxID=196820 RepID=UPI0033184F9A
MNSGKNDDDVKGEKEVETPLATVLQMSPSRENYARRTASLNAEAALKCLTEASRKMRSSPSYVSRKRNSQADSPSAKRSKPDVITAMPYSMSSFGENLPNTSISDSEQQSLKPIATHSTGDEEIENKSVVSLPSLSPDFYVRRTASLNATACMSALLSPAKKPKLRGDSSSNSAAVSAVEDNVKIEPVADAVTKVIENQDNASDSDVLEIVSVGGVEDEVQPTLVDPLRECSTEVKKSLVVPVSEEAVKRLVEEGVEVVAKTAQRKPSKFSRRKSIRKYYIGMRRKSEALFVRDNATFWSGGHDKLPYVGKILSFWQETSEMMCTVYWYYQPDDENLLEDELLASQHVDHNPVAAIIEKCYVLGLSKYCRYKTMLKRDSEGFATRVTAERFVSKAKKSLYQKLQIPDNLTDPNLVFLCQKSYNYKTGKVSGRK